MPTAEDPPRSLASILPEGTDPPEHIPADIFEAALETYLACRRIDMGQLANRLGMSRPTLWRKIGGRDGLLGEILWYRVRLGVAEAWHAAGDRSGIDRILFCNEHIMRRVSGQAPLRRLLDQEPEIALRVLTSKDGPVQAGAIETQQRLLEEEQARGLVLAIPAETLAFAICRMTESFLYADVIADQEPDVDRAVEVIRSLVLGQAVDG